MLTVANVEKFLLDQFFRGTWHIQQEEVQRIVDRAKREATADGRLLNGSLNKIFNGDRALIVGLEHAMGTSLEHQQLAVDALREPVAIVREAVPVAIRRRRGRPRKIR